MSSGQSITIKLAGDEKRSTGSGPTVKCVSGIPAERSVSLGEANAPGIELVGLKPADEARRATVELIGETQADFGPSGG